MGRGKLLLRCGVLGDDRRFGAHRGRRVPGHIVVAAAYSLFCMRVNSLYVKCYTLNWKYGHEKTKYGIRFHLLLMYHVIPRMRNANFVNKCGAFGTLSISFEH